MVLYSSIAAFVTPVAYLLATSVSAAPHEDHQAFARVGLFQRGLVEREDQDDTDADIAADGTGPLRDGK